jgi:hypothetical protein
MRFAHRGTTLITLAINRTRARSLRDGRSGMGVCCAERGPGGQRLYRPEMTGH